jgi:hypothetical protein
MTGPGRLTPAERCKLATEDPKSARRHHLRHRGRRRARRGVRGRAAGFSDEHGRCACRRGTNAAWR